MESKFTNTLNNGSIYDHSYFIEGRKSGKSLYEDYRWMPDLTIPMVQKIIGHLGIDKDDVIVDYGCARGYVVRAFRELGYEAYGVDVSEWAIANCDETVKQYLSLSEKISPGMDWIICKDVLEHIPTCFATVTRMMDAARKGVFAVVPLAGDNGTYVVPDYEKDCTHIHRLTLREWLDPFIFPGWVVECSYRIPGIKDNYFLPGWETGNGFIVGRRQP